MPYEANYELEVSVEVTDEEARDAFLEYNEDMGWDDWEESRVAAAEYAARMKTGLKNEDDVTVQELRSRGTREVNDD